MQTILQCKRANDEAYNKRVKSLFLFSYSTQQRLSQLTKEVKFDKAQKVKLNHFLQLMENSFV